jgi:hypothetical protein
LDRIRIKNQKRGNKMYTKLSLRYLAVISISAVIFSGCGNDAENVVSDPNHEISRASLTKKWETKAVLGIVESAVYDKNKACIYASNVNSEASGKVWGNNNGFISKIDTNGNILALKWITGLKAPKGLALYKEHLYAADNHTIADINTSNGKIVHIFEAPKGTDHLNDLAYDTATHTIYASDEADNQIWKISTDGKFTLFHQLDPSKNTYLNGLLVDGNQLIIQGTKGYLKSIDLATKKTKILADTMERVRIDGIQKYKDKGYIASKVGEKIYFVSNHGASKAFDIKNPARVADITYIPELDLLLAPDFKHRIIAYTIEVETVNADKNNTQVAQH